MNQQSITWANAPLMAEDLQWEVGINTHSTDDIARRESELRLGLRAVMNGLCVISALFATVALQNQMGFAMLALVAGFVAASVIVAAATR